MKNLSVESTDYRQKRLMAKVLLVVGILFLIIFLWRLPGLIALYNLYWGGEGIRSLLYEDLGFSDSWSHFLSVVGAFVYALAWVPLTVWTYRLVAWRFDARQLVIAFASWVFVYGHAPLLHALFGTHTCFNQRTGEPMKWYVELSDGTIVLYDSAGYDTATGAQKKPVNVSICVAYDKQRTNERPHKITADIGTIEFFDPVTSRPRVWYTKNTDGTYTLYDARGFDPASGTPLQPITADIVRDIRAQAAAAKEDQRRRDAEQQSRRQEQQDKEAPDKRAQDDAARKAQQDKIDRENAERQRDIDRANAVRQQQEIDRRNAEIQRQVEAQRQQMEQQRQLDTQREEWRRTHGGCNYPTHSQYFDCQRTSAPECIHIGGNGGYACVP
jgi:hypothetical protein